MHEHKRLTCRYLLKLVPAERFRVPDVVVLYPWLHIVWKVLDSTDS